MINIHHLQVIFFQGHILQGAQLPQILLKSLLSYLTVGWMLVKSLQFLFSFFFYFFLILSPNGQAYQITYGKANTAKDIA